MVIYGYGRSCHFPFQCEEMVFVYHSKVKSRRNNLGVCVRERERERDDHHDNNDKLATMAMESALDKNVHVHLW